MSDPPPLLRLLPLASALRFVRLFSLRLLAEEGALVLAFLALLQAQCVEFAGRAGQGPPPRPLRC